MAAENSRKKKIETKRAQLNWALAMAGTNLVKQREIREQLRALEREDEAARNAYQAALNAFTT